MDGKTVIRIYYDKSGKLNYQIMMGDVLSGWDIIGALEIIKSTIVKSFQTAEHMNDGEINKSRKLLDG
jgi:hypothetical protein